MRIAKTDPAGLIDKAVAYGAAPFEAARLAYGFSYDPGNPRRVPVNRFAHRRTLADHRHRMVTTPNNDTLYSSAVIDLSAGPVELAVPAFGDRYHSVALLDAYTNAFAYIGTRATGNAGGVCLIAGPTWQGQVPDHVRLIRAPGNHISAHIRILVDGVADYAAVHVLQDQCLLTGAKPERLDLIPPCVGDGENFVAVVNQVLRDNPPPPDDAPYLRELAQTGIGAATLTSEQRQWWAAHFSECWDRLVAASVELGSCLEGWQYLPSNTGNFGVDYETRAKIAIRGVIANVAAESVYTVALSDRNGALLDQAYSYRLHLPAGAPPVAGFWSLSIYESLPDGRMFFGDNELHRYAIGDRTRGLIRNADGSIDILIQKNRPEGSVNWLPVPAARFALIMRAYLPDPVFLDGRFRYPGIERDETSGATRD
jgi:hypothetical protein